ncbi:MAG: hypothetical protein EAX86_13370 [Candidatus Heimdallarchaeota archaeon]|nr:hypothetical protein [Candidatus Heimdallarchaeota archaeon]
MSEQKNNQLGNSYGFFLYFYDEQRGHVPLFTYPPDLAANEDEQRIIKIHPIWWHQDKFIETEKFDHMDLEMEGINYSATLLQCKSRRTKKRSGMESLKWRMERFILIIRSPSRVSFIAQEILYELKLRITGNLGEKLCYLVEKSLLLEEKEPIEEEIHRFADHVENELKSLCDSLIPKVSLEKLNYTLPRFSEEDSSSEASRGTEAKLEKRRFVIPSSRIDTTPVKKSEVNLSIKPKRVKIVEIKHNNSHIEVTAKNTNSKPINNVLLRVYESQGFFGHDLEVFKIKTWEPEEQVSIKFKPKPDPGTIYFLKIEDDHETIKIRRILG